jgi:hypothetical protein
LGKNGFYFPSSPLAQHPQQGEGGILLFRAILGGFAAQNCPVFFPPPPSLGAGQGVGVGNPHLSFVFTPLMGNDKPLCGEGEKGLFEKYCTFKNFSPLSL